MEAALRYRVEVTPELVARAAPQLEALFAWWGDRAEEAAGARQRLLGVVRWLGLGLSLLGIALAGLAIVVAPGCGSRGSTLFYDAVMPFFVVTGTIFAFWPRVHAELRGWARRTAARQAARLGQALARAAPYAAEYQVARGLLTGRVDRPKAVRTTALRRVQHAAFGAEVALLYGARFPWPVKRVVWLPEGAAREALRAALGAAGATVAELPAAPAPVEPGSSRQAWPR